MQTAPRHSGDMSHDSARGPLHPTDVQEDAFRPSTGARPAAPALRPAIDPAARATKRMYNGLSASAAGLELGIAVGLGSLFGSWLDGQLGTEPWMLLVFLIVGVIAGFRGLLRAVARAEKADASG